ncbi:hypothetical protein NDI44_18955 [Trichocoleus sp. DQ-A3]|uniref:hypothetical protein n=1 Tax=Cyanophyceae TaxID=3028117 RepID=UPI001688B688|nr:hypothetical protein [Coleofasciculus sp. FACHB-125]MBD1901966.1 hypothetical protein [Coleofasciculus sp. FACHB-125]
MSSRQSSANLSPNLLGKNLYESPPEVLKGISAGCQTSHPKIIEIPSNLGWFGANSFYY